MDILSLLEKPFSARTMEEKLSILEKGKPKPDMSKLSMCSKQGRRTITRSFSNSRFDEIPWLTGCSKRNKLYCWPCVLFNVGSSVWTKEGYSDLNHLSLAIQRHEKSKKHLEADFSLKVLGLQIIYTAVSNQSLETLTVSCHSENVRANRKERVSSNSAERILRNLPKPTSSQNFTRLCSVDDELMQSPSAEDEKFMRESCGTAFPRTMDSSFNEGSTDSAHTRGGPTPKRRKQAKPDFKVAVTEMLHSNKEVISEVPPNREDCRNCNTNQYTAFGNMVATHLQALPHKQAKRTMMDISKCLYAAGEE